MVHIYIGDGKGKTTAALGLALRAWGFGRKVYIGEFLKDVQWPAGELKAAEKIADSDFVIERFHRQVHPMFSGNTDTESLKKSIEQSLKRIESFINRKKFDLIVMDEILNCIKNRFVSAKEVENIVRKAKKKEVELVLTGRDAPVLLQKAADYISRVGEINHPYRRGVMARAGIDY